MSDQFAAEIHSPPCPWETFEALDALPFVCAIFVQRCPGVDVFVDRETALERLARAHRATADAAGFAGMEFVSAEQVHGAGVAVVSSSTTGVLPDADGLATATPGLCLAVYVADCAAVYLVDREQRAVALVHSGRKGTQREIVPRAIETMGTAFGSTPENLVVQISPCIRPPHYEVDFAEQIIRQARNAGVVAIHDSAACTACNPASYYSYRLEKGRTGRMLALLAIAKS